MKLICFPHAGGYACYYNFFDKIKFSVIDSINYYEYPGRGRCIDTSEESNFSQRVFNAVSYVNELEVQANEYALFGHSMGAFVAYEVGRILQKEYNLPPAVIFISGQVPPCMYETDVKNIMEGFGGNEKFIKYLGGIPDFILRDKEVVDYYIQLTIKDFNILKTYKPILPYPDEKLPYGVIFYGTEDIIINPMKIQQWKKNIKHICEIIVYPGNHFYISKEFENVARIMDEWTFKINNILKMEVIE